MRASCHPHCEPESQGELAAVQSSFQRIACAFIDSTQRRTPQPNWQLALVWKQQTGSEQEAAAVGGETVTLTLSFQPEPSTSSSLPHTRISLVGPDIFRFLSPPFVSCPGNLSRHLPLLSLSGLALRSRFQSSKHNRQVVIWTPLPHTRPQRLPSHASCWAEPARLLL